MNTTAPNPPKKVMEALQVIDDACRGKSDDAYDAILDYILVSASERYRLEINLEHALGDIKFFESSIRSQKNAMADAARYACASMEANGDA